LVGKGPGRYNLYLGAAYDGSRLSKLYAEDVEDAGVARRWIDFRGYAAERQKGERFGDSPSAPALSPPRRTAPIFTTIPRQAGK